MGVKELVGKIAEFKENPNKWGIVKSASDCGECIYLQTFGENPGGCTYLGVNRNLLRFMK